MPALPLANQLLQAYSAYGAARDGVGFFFSTSVPTLPEAISRSAITVGLSRFGSTSGRGAGAELARAVGRGERELEAVGNALQAIVNGDAGHGGFRSFPFRMMLRAARALAASKSLLIIGI